MGTMWSRGGDLDADVERYTVADDPQVDVGLIEYEVAGALAHARALARLGVLDEKESKAIASALDELLHLAAEGGFGIRTDEEDCHGAVERFLVKRAGRCGLKLHLGRSRNEQVASAVRLYCKKRLGTLLERIGTLGEAFRKKIEEVGSLPISGYTHSQRAMPTTVGVWLESYVALLEDDAALLRHVLSMVDRSPLGSAAGFGTPVPLDREALAEDAGFARVQENPLSCQNCRVKEAALVAFALWQVAATLGKFAADCLLFSTEEFAFLRLPEEFTTGSSIMPNKRNYDLFEVTRARMARVAGIVVGLMTLGHGLISGYHRDYQLMKKPLVEAFDLVVEAVPVVGKAVASLEFNRERLEEVLDDPAIHATERAVKMALEDGVPYREAYFMVKEQLFGHT